MKHCITILVLTITFGVPPTVDAGPFFFDDFEDGNATDGSPVTWNETYPPWNTGTREVINGDYVLTPDVSQPTGRGNWETDSNVDGLLFQDFSLRTQARVLGLENPAGIGFNARDTHPASNDGQTGHNIYAYLATNGAVFIGTAENNESAEEVTAMTDLRPTDYDVMLRLDVIGEDVKLWAWQEGESRPAAPQITYRLPGRPPTPYNTPGQVGIWNGQLDADASGVTVPVAFRYFEAVPEPSTFALFGIGIAGLIASLRRRN